MVDNHDLLCKAKHKLHLEPLNTGYIYGMMQKII